MATPKQSSNTSRQARPRKAKSATSKAGKTARPTAKATSASPRKSRTKQSILIDQLRRPDGATIADLVKVTGWQAHSVRGAISGALKKKLGLSVTSETVEGRGRVYRIVDAA